MKAFFFLSLTKAQRSQRLYANSFVRFVRNSFFILFLVIALLSCVKSANDKTLIGYITCGDDIYQNYLKDAFCGYFDDKPQYQIEFENPGDDAARQAAIAANLIVKGAAALVVVPVDTSATLPIVEAAASADIPLVFVNRNPFGNDTPPAGVYYVGSREIVAGQIQADAAGRLLSGEGGVAILEGRLDNEGALLRTRGVEETLKAKFPRIKILAKESGNWQRPRGKAIAENWLAAFGGDLGAIISNNDEMALGALEAAEAAGRGIVIIGVDCIPEAAAAIEAGKLTATVYQDYRSEGGRAAETVLGALAGEQAAQVVWIPFVYIDKSNIAQFR
jgi:inositol transport system substrate-binding protein